MQKINSVDHTQNIIEIKNIFFGYDNENVLENINLNIHKGDYIGFVGPNGSGKTTLVKIIIGLLKPRSGMVKIFGKDLVDFKEWWRIGYVPQQLVNFEKNFPLTVNDVVSMGCYAKRSYWQRIRREDKVAVEKALKKVDMWNYRERLIGELSGGQMQRVFIARTLVSQPEIIFLDEPTSGIDEKNQNEFYELLQKLNKQMGITLIMVSHDIARVTQEVMHIVCINKTLTCHTSPEEFIKESQSANFFGQDVKIITHHKHN